MSYIKNRIFKSSTVAIFCSYILIISCSEVLSPKTVNTRVAVADANAKYCPEGSGNTQLDLNNIKLKREKNIPLIYQGYNNIEGPVVVGPQVLVGIYNPAH